jgi:hypothetical protein
MMPTWIDAEVIEDGLGQSWPAGRDLRLLALDLAGLRTEPVETALSQKTRLKPYRDRGVT